MGKRCLRTFERMTPFSRGVIYGMSIAGLEPSEIAAEVEKPGGATPTRVTVHQVLKACAANGGMAWDWGSVNRWQAPEDHMPSGRQGNRQIGVQAPWTREGHCGLHTSSVSEEPCIFAQAYPTSHS